MKTILNSGTPKPLSILIAVVALLAISFTSCSKKDSDSTIVVAALMVTNAAETSTPQDFYLDDVKVNASALAYTQSTGYVGVLGNRVAEFRTSGTATVNSSFDVNFKPGQYYSLYYTDDKSVAALENDPTPPASGKARVRFINLSSSVSSNVDFAISGGAKVVSDLSYKTASAYNEVNAATSFSFNVSGSSSVLLSIPTTIQAGKIYTIYVSGATNATLTYHVVLEN